MATGGEQAAAAEEVVSVEMPAPQGWTKKVAVFPSSLSRVALCSASIPSNWALRGRIREAGGRGGAELGRWSADLRWILGFRG